MEAHQNPPWNSNGSLTDILNAHDAGPATPMPPAPGPPASHSGAPHFVGTASPVSLPAVENHATSINPNHARPSRKSTRDWKPAQPAAAPEVPKETPPWLKEMLPDVTSDQPEPKSEAKFYKAGPDTPQASFPFPVDPESAPRRQGSKLRLTSFTAPAKLEVVKEKGAFISEVLHKRGDEGEEPVPWSHLTVPKQKRKWDEAEAEEDADDGRPKVLVIHPGSRNMRIGRADDPIPLTLPHVLARKVGHVSELAKPTPTRFPEQDPPLPQADPDHPDGQEVARPKVNKDAVRYPPSHLPELNHAKLKTAKPLLENDLRTRARNQKIRLLTGATASIAVISFNSEQLPEGELVPEVNDRGRMEWTEVWQRQGMAMAGISRRQDMAGGVAKDIGNKVYFGEEALNVPNFSYPSTRPLPVGAPIYELRYPFKNGMPNTAAYKSLYEWLDDVEELWGWAASKAGVPRAERHKWRCVLVLPDDWEKGAWGIVDRVVGNLGFGRVACIQESLAASWGAGFSHSVVVDMGEGKTSVTIVDDGLIVPETRMVARYGASDVSLLLLHFLFQAALPFNRPLTANLVCDRRLLDGIKEEHCHADAFGLGESMQMIQYESREPEASTRKWDAKVYEEVCLAPLVYFYPWILDYRVKLAGLAGFAGQQPTWLEKAGRTVEIQTMDGMVWEGKEVKKGKAGAVLSGRPPTPSVSAAEVETAASEHPASSSVGTPTVATAPPLLPGAPQPASSSAADGEDPTVPLALDDMIVAVLVRYYRHCQINSPRDAESRLRKLAENIFLVGGGAQLAGIAEELQDRVGVKLNERAVLPAVEAKDGTGAVPPVWVNVGVSNKVPREVDGRFVGWKGGSVFGRMDAARDCWVGYDEWQSGGAVRACLLKWGIPWPEPEVANGNV